MNTIQRVYDLIGARNLTLMRLAKLSGVNYSTIKTAERRNGQLSLDTIERLCQAMDIPLYEFFHVEELEDAAGQ